ncbi:MAG: helix-turn-helix domain-containing protein [Alphaproteobacteria bacterium]
MTVQFGTLLKDWRDQRRISQMDLGLSANVSARHISFLETGRSRPSRPMILHLSETLNIPRRERNTLLSAAGFAHAYFARDIGDDDMAQIRAAVNWTLMRHDPFPAVAFDRHWNILKMNTCAAGLLGIFGLGQGDSLLASFLDNTAFRAAVKNREEIGHDLISRLRAESAHFGGDAVLDAFAERLAADLGGDSEPRSAPAKAVIPNTYSVGGLTYSFFSTISQFGSAEDIALADMKIEMMFPADEATRQIFMPS